MVTAAGVGSGLLLVGSTSSKEELDNFTVNCRIVLWLCSMGRSLCLNLRFLPRHGQNDKKPAVFGFFEPDLDIKNSLDGYYD